MVHASRFATALASIVFSALALAGCSSPQAEPVPTSTPVAIPTPTPSYATELPDWAKEDGMLWLVYPEGLECVGTEGCPNDYGVIIGKPGEELPEGVEYYDPAKHDCVMVFPVGVTC